MAAAFFMIVAIPTGSQAGAALRSERASASTGTPAEAAITSFSGGANVDHSFAALSAQLANPSQLRDAALKHLGSSAAAVHFAALYALSLVATPGKANTALASLFQSTANDRVLAASGVAASGDSRGLPVLIDLLRDESRVSYRDPPEHVWQLARVSLLNLTTQDFGLRKATTSTAAAKTQAAWTTWWQTKGASLRWDPTLRKFVAGTAARTLQAVRPPTTPYVPDAIQHRSENTVNATGGGSQVTITVPVDIMGGKPVYVATGQGGLDPRDQTAMWKRAAESEWNAAFKRFHYHPVCPGGKPTKLGVHIHLKVDIKVIPLGSTGRANAHKVFFNSNPHFRSYVDVPHWKGHDSTAPYGESNNATSTWGPEEPWAIAHEVGHLLGIGDDYTDQIQNGETVSVPNGGRGGTLMGDFMGRIDRQLVNRLGKLLEQAGLLPPGAGCKARRFAIRGGGYEGTTDDGGSVDFFVSDVRGDPYPTAITRNQLWVNDFSLRSGAANGLNNRSEIDCEHVGGGASSTSGWATGGQEGAWSWPIRLHAFHIRSKRYDELDHTEQYTIDGTFTSSTTAQGTATVDVEPASGWSCSIAERTLTWHAHFIRGTRRDAR